APAEVVRDAAERLERVSLGAEQREGVLVGHREAVGGATERAPDVRLDPLRSARVLLPPASDLQGVEVPVDGEGVLPETATRSLGIGERDLTRLPPHLLVLPRDRSR